MEARHESSIVPRIDGGKVIPFWADWGEDLIRGLRKTLLVPNSQAQDDVVCASVFWRNPHLTEKLEAIGLDVS